MKRALVFLLTGLALGSGLADAGRRSGGGFGGSRSSGGSYGGSYRSPSYRSPSTPTYRTPSTPRYTPPANSSSGSTYTRPRSAPPAGSGTTRTPSTTQRSTLPSNRTVANNAANRAAAAQVKPTQLNNWKSVKLPAGVPRNAITYSATPSSQYRYQLEPGRYYPYPQSYYRQHGIGYDILKYALIFTAVSSVADALDGPDVVVNNVNPGGAPGNTPVVVQQNRGPNLWSYVGVGFLAAAAAWFVTGRRR